MILHARGVPHGFLNTVLGRLTFEALEDPLERPNCILVTSDVDGQDVDGYAGLLSYQKLVPTEIQERLRIPTVSAIPATLELKAGQVVIMNGQTGFVRILFRPDSRFNSIFATDRCNSRCLMCSQPPRDIDDSDRIYEHLRLVELMDPETEYLGVTGGEPTLLKDDLCRLLAKCKETLRKAHLHILTNGRLFYYDGFARRIAEVGHPRVTWAIPLYSDIANEHDYVVQGDGAFHQTTVGIYNLARYRQSVEIRVVLHALTYRRLPQVAEYVWRNFPFASHVALMGLEVIGYAKANLGLLWTDPYNYQSELEAAVSFLANRGMQVSIFNHQLCILREPLWPFAEKAISDWKNVYLQECESCVLQESCGGFFASSLTKHSTHIMPFLKVPAVPLDVTKYPFSPSNSR
jgi:His-Xaa-Ser system radical SAM maturase HxsC